MNLLNRQGRTLADHLKRLVVHESQTAEYLAKSEKINVVSAGGAITAAYEHLRNAAENTDEHLLRQNAIRRFYKRLLITRDSSLASASGSELVVELTLAGYIENDSITRAQVDKISVLSHKYYSAYEALFGSREVSGDEAFRWLLDDLSVRVEYILSDHMRDMVFTDFACSQMALLIDTAKKTEDSSDTKALLYAAVHKALLKSNAAVIRSLLLTRYGNTVDNFDEYVAANQKIDSLLASPQADRLYRLVNRQGVPLRILRKMIDNEVNLAEILENRDKFLAAYEQQVNAEYEMVGSRLNRAIFRSIIFLIITKFLVGIAIEVPYDYWAHNEIIWLPLIINLFFPPAYMFMLRMTLKLPGYANTNALVNRIDTMLYGEKSVIAKIDTAPRRFGPIFSISYILISLAIFVAVIYLLLLLQFSAVHIVIFFIFVSAASFLGFRISRSIREIEMVKTSANSVTFTRDMLYLPFVVVGQWVSEKYSRVNIVAIVLDMLIELPMKSILRIVRQWIAFIDDRKDNI